MTPLINCILCIFMHKITTNFASNNIKLQLEYENDEKLDEKYQSCLIADFLNFGKIHKNDKFGG